MICLRDAIANYLSERFNNTVTYHRSKGRKINLTYSEFFELVKAYGGMIRLLSAYSKFLKSGLSRFRYDRVLGWKTHSAFLTQVVSKDTMSWMDPKFSKLTGKNMKGESRPLEVRQKISATRKGMTFTDDHRAHLSKSLTGRTQSEEQKAKRRETWQKKREAADLSNTETGA